MRGDDASEVVWARPENGTPPRARGRRHRRRVRGTDQRNTPACAGTIGRWSSPRAGSREHPRVRGDDLMVETGTRSYPGTPPRARGRRGEHRRQLLGRRNTPACAGTTVSVNEVSPAPPEHPRVRGDDVLRGNPNPGNQGTPPRARGRPQRCRQPGDACGNTPACGGTTGDRSDLAWLIPEHPRVRGDDSGSTVRRPVSRGTPPRARGRRLPRGAGPSGGRNTPACAGTTPGGTRPPAVGTEHPRVRGDDDQAGVVHPVTAGTPPRARGRHVQRGLDRHQRRNTPACAGTTLPGSALSPLRPEHPRVRGDDPAPRGASVGRHGTPPRARGRPRLP